MNNTYIESFSMRDLFTLTGQTGLWRVKTIIRGLGISVVYRLTNPTKTVRVLTSNLSRIVDIRVAVVHKEKIHRMEDFIDPKMITVSIMFERMYDLSQYTTLDFDPIMFDRAATDTQHALMLSVVPSADVSKFLPFHFSKILRWYADLELAISMIEPEEILELS